MRDLDELDKRLLNLLQEECPLDPRPYAQLGTALGLGEEDVIQRVRRLKEGKIIRQISAIFDTRSLGYQSSLVAMKVPPKGIDEAAQVLNAHPGISHNYRRNHDFNLWFTIALPPQSSLEGTVSRLHQLAGAEATRLMPTLRLFKIGVRMDMTGEEDMLASSEPSYTWRQRDQAMERPVSQGDIPFIRELQEDIEVIPSPFQPMARRLEVSEEELLERARGFITLGHMRRFAAILHHRQAGFAANGMGVWRVPEDKVDDVGTKMASFNAVTHCYLRPTYPDWPYNVFTMIHGRKVKDCQEVADAISEATGVEDYTILYSSTEYKKTRVKYFTLELDEWERHHMLKADASATGS